MGTRRAFAILLPGLFILFQFYLVFIKHYRVLDYSRYVNEFPQPFLGEERQVQKPGQTFRSPGPLARIDIMLATYGVTPNGGSLQLGIYDDRQCLFLENIPAPRVQDNRFHTFLIPRGKVPAGSYFLELRFLPDRRERMAVWVSRKDLYPHGDFFLNGKKQGGDITFRVYYRSTLWQARNNILEKIPALWMGRFWLIAGFLMVLAALNFLFYYLVLGFVHRTPFREKILGLPKTCAN